MNPKPKILVVGDVMLDHYRIADATRISPEAPVPVLLNPRDEYRPGGAASVALMCAALGAEVLLLGVTGNDDPGQRLQTLLEAAGVGCYLIALPDRPTTVKQRICAVASGRHRQQLARVDTESTAPIPDDLSEILAAMIRNAFTEPDAPRVDAVIVSDYAKGVCTEPVARACVDSGCAYIDPPKGQPWDKYRGAACIVPNREEAGPLAVSTAWDMRKRYGMQAAVIKLDQDGCRVDEDETQWEYTIPSQARTVHDVTGAGDQFIAALALARIAGKSWHAAAEQANTAAGIQVERHGCVPVTRREMDEATERASGEPRASATGSSDPRTGESGR